MMQDSDYFSLSKNIHPSFSEYIVHVPILE